MSSQDSQPSLDFDAPRSEAGYGQWQAQRQSALAALAQKLRLPLGRRVEVWLRDGVRLRGTLMVEQLPLFPSEFWDPDTPLHIGRASFSPAEIESCVVLEEP